MASEFGVYIDNDIKIYDDEVMRPDLQFCRQRAKHCDFYVNTRASQAWRMFAERLKPA